jgi:outer membrane protein OmpA-like peptidoglycan-associated protein
MKKVTTIIILAFLTLPLFSQQRWVDVAENGDCISAILVNINDTTNAIASPDGYGKVLEFKNNDKKSLLYIEREHNTVWYQFEVPADGALTFEITPFRIEDDYDFMLFQYEEDERIGFCEAVRTQKIQPIRTNIARNNKEIGSKTGLLESGRASETVHSGPGEGYSKLLDAKKGTRYYLLVDNVYKNGKGHQLTFKYKKYEKEEPVQEVIKEVIPLKPEPPVSEVQSKVKQFKVEGVVTDDETKQPIAADVNLIDAKNGEIIAQTRSDSLTGEYTITLDQTKSLRDVQLFKLEISKDGYFFDSQDIPAYKLPNLDGIKVSHRIPKLKKGKTFNISNINFYGNEARPLPQSLPTFKALLKVMKKNKSLKINIEGHTNGCGHGKVFSEKLSTGRAKTVTEYLITNGIKKNRIKYGGSGCSKMLYPNALNATEQMLNRRVEIEVLEY